MISLPEEIFCKIAIHLDLKTLLALSLVSRQIYLKIEQNRLWEILCLRDFKKILHYKTSCTDWKHMYISLKNPSIYFWGTGELSKNILGDEKKSVVLHVPYKLGKASGINKCPLSIGLSSWYTCHLRKLSDLFILDHWRLFSKVKEFGHFEIPKYLGHLVSLAGDKHRFVGLGKDGRVWVVWDSGKEHELVGFNSKAVNITANSVLTDQNELWFIPKTYSLFGGEPNYLRAIFVMKFDEKIIQLVNLSYHMLALTKSGRVFLMHTWDYNEAHNIKENHTIELVHFGGSEKRSIWGSYTKFAVCIENGDVLFGDINFKTDWIPKRYPGLNYRSVHKVCFGRGHFGALTTKGELLTWGKLDISAIGQGRNPVDINTPHYVEELRGKYVVDIEFNENQSVAMVIDKS